MKVDYHAVGQRIKQRRKAAGKTQDNLAEKLAVSVGYVSQLERGATRISLDTLAAVAGILGCGVSELLDGACPATPYYLTPEFSRVFAALDAEQRRLLLRIAEVMLQE